jgi:hypothetical protein
MVASLICQVSFHFVCVSRKRDGTYGVHVGTLFAWYSGLVSLGILCPSYIPGIPNMYSQESNTPFH